MTLLLSMLEKIIGREGAGWHIVTLGEEGCDPTSLFQPRAF
jgi:hypothetical protein